VIRSSLCCCFRLVLNVVEVEKNNIIGIVNILGGGGGGGSKPAGMGSSSCI
jgi:hypothetical protein